MANIEFKQVTCIEHWEDNDEEFNKLMDSIKAGCSKGVVCEMNTWPKSNLDPISYGGILHLAAEHDEAIVYDDFNYLLSANDNIIVLYQRIN